MRDDKITRVSDILLAIETSMRCDSLYLARLSRERRDVDAELHEPISAAIPLSAALLPAIRQMLGKLSATPRDIRLAAFSQGPGSFTGLRVAATLMRMLQSTVKCDVVGVPTFAAIAFEAREWLRSAGLFSTPCPPDRLLIALPAKRGHVFVSSGHLSESGFQHEWPAEMIPVHELWSRLAPRCAIVCDPAIPLFSGNPHQTPPVPDPQTVEQFVVLPPERTRPAAATIATLARALHRAGRRLRPQEIVPLYVRRPECEEVAERNRAAARLRRGE